MPELQVGLDGRRVAITGASRGIAAAVARALVRDGAAVALLHHPAAEMTRLANELASELGPSARTFATDLREPEQIAHAFGDIAGQLGGVDILINNAAVSRVGPWDALSVEEWDELMAVNVRAAWLCARAVADSMRREGWGRIINVGSVEVALGTAEALAYTTSKAALIGLTRSLARALGGHGICVNAVVPGAIRTELELEAYGTSPEQDLERIAAQSVPRRGTPEDLVGLFAYLCSEASDFTTGQAITVDGGWTYG